MKDAYSLWFGLVCHENSNGFYQISVIYSHIILGSFSRTGAASVQFHQSWVCVWGVWVCVCVCVGGGGGGAASVPMK